MGLELLPDGRDRSGEAAHLERREASLLRIAASGRSACREATRAQADVLQASAQRESASWPEAGSAGREATQLQAQRTAPPRMGNAVPHAAFVATLTAGTVEGFNARGGAARS